MADNVAITAGTGTTVATDDVGGVHYQIIKNAYGALDTATLVTATNGLPTQQLDTTATGTISATDALGGTPGGAGVLISTAPTANSFVAAAIPGGSSQIDVQILGTATGTYYFEYSMDSTTGSDGAWVTGLFRQSGINNTVLTLGATTNGIFRGAAAAFKYFRLRNVGGTTPSNAITIRTSNGGGTTFLNASLPAGSNIIGKVNISSATTGGLTTHTLISAATTNATSVKGSAGTVYSIQASNTGAAVAFLKIFNKATAPTVGTDTAVKTLILPAGGGTNVSFADIGIALGTGIAYSVTGLATTADTTAVALAQVVINIDYV